MQTERTNQFMYCKNQKTNKNSNKLLFFFKDQVYKHEFQWLHINVLYLQAKSL